MSSYAVQASKRRWPKILAIILIIAGLLVGGSAVGVYKYYQSNLRPVNASQKRVTVTVESGASLREIAGLLKTNGLIRSEWAFERYVRNAGLEDSLQAGTYSFQPSQSVQEIIVVLTHGDIVTDLVTILPGLRIDQVRKALIDSGFDAAAVDAAMNPALYKDHPALVDKPSDANLEGYLYPESFQKTAISTPEEIIRAALNEMQKRLTPEVRNGMVAQGLTVHQGIILASMVEQEVSNPEDKPKVAQVFLRRLNQGITLGSDITAPYGAVLAGEQPSIFYQSPYNTHNNKGLPPTPISNVSENSLLAVANPSPTDWLFFVAGDDGITYFSRTVQEHEALVAKHCKQLCNLE